jgi:hypothetical protein
VASFHRPSGFRDSWPFLARCRPQQKRCACPPARRSLQRDRQPQVRG